MLFQTCIHYLAYSVEYKNILSIFSHDLNINVVLYIFIWFLYLAYIYPFLF